MGECQLVLIEWEDSAQPIAQWQRLEDMELGGIVRCVSVGWLVVDDEEKKVLAPNMGGGEHNLQACGVIQIPARSITRICRVEEAD